MAKLTYPLTESVLEKADLKAAIKVINSKKITMGKKTQELESFFKDNIEYLKKSFFILCLNSSRKILSLIKSYLSLLLFIFFNDKYSSLKVSRQEGSIPTTGKS